MLNGAVRKLADLEEIEEGEIVVRIEAHGANYFRKYESPKALYEEIDQLPEEDRCFHELINEGSQLLRFDIDIGEYSREKNEETREFVKAIIKASRREIADNANFWALVFSSTSREKISYHIILGHQVESHLAARQFCSEIVEKFQDNPLSQSIDTGVYKKRQFFRLYLCHKPDSNRTKLYVPDLSFGVDEDLGEEDIFLLSLVSNVDEHPTYHIEIPDRVESTAKLENVGDDEIISRKICELEGTDKLAYQPRGLTGENIGSFVTYLRVARSKCIICKRFHDGDNIGILRRANGDVMLHCYRAQESTFLVSLREKPKKLREQERETELNHSKEAVAKRAKKLWKAIDRVQDEPSPPKETMREVSELYASITPAKRTPQKTRSIQEIYEKSS